MQRIYSVHSTAPTHDQLALQETIFHNANGYLGVRGTLEEGAPQGMDTMRGAYVNGFYEIVPMKQAEKLTHVREDKESMINVADVQGIRFCLESGFPNGRARWWHASAGWIWIAESPNAALRGARPRDGRPPFASAAWPALRSRPCS